MAPKAIFFLAIFSICAVTFFCWFFQLFFRFINEIFVFLFSKENEVTIKIKCILNYLMILKKTLMFKDRFKNETCPYKEKITKTCFLTLKLSDMIDMRRNTITSNAYKMAKRTRIILQYENLKAWHKILGTRSYRLNASNSAIFYLLKVNNRNTRKRCGICLKLTIKTSDVVLVFLLLNLNIFHTISNISIVDSEQVNVDWE